MLEVTDLTKHFGRFCALDGLSLSSSGKAAAYCEKLFSETK